uniref:SusD/RagB family nutrient-binding outer membrane lipoprotein n=1 Tax=Roseihalotalea indica TaxID=2867963 RepID=A0AA49GTK2_9BACT|nr:SusD/RagB family nutrient-binding outer membrane lipoprotein [Tunicatimonas sp. TK19036]
MRKILLTILGICILISACDEDDFAELNQNPSNVTEPDLSYLFTESLFQLDGYVYTEWFYDNAQYLMPWTLTTVAGGGNSDLIVLDGEHGSRVSAWYRQIMPGLADIRQYVDNRYEGTEQASYQYLRAITYPIQIMQGIKVTDIYGSQPYEQAMRARYTNPPLLTPEYDPQEELFNLWISQLDSTISILQSPVMYEGDEVSQITLNANQDFVYSGDYSKWARFANSLKLRIAARLYQQNSARAIEIVEEAASNPAGLIVEAANDFYWKPGSEYDHFGGNSNDNDIAFGVGSKNLIDFLRDNQDPRLKFLFEKNSYNSMVIQAFYDEGVEIPSYIEEYVNYSEGADGNKVFEGWKAPGEPWVRFFGAPASPDATQNQAIYAEYFNTNAYQLENKSYTPLSYYNEKNIRPYMNLTYPDVPAVTNVYDADVSYSSNLFSSAETNLYLAEFKLLGAGVPEDANSYFQRAIAQSVMSHDMLAASNDILYYNSAYDQTYGAPVALQSGEIEALLAQEEYALTGNTALDLEKVYIQEYIHFLSNPNELFVTSRRSGIPKKESTILPREVFTSGGIELVIPRRFSISTPTLDDINYDNQIEALQEQGFTPGSNEPQVLNAERLWYDQGAPAWGSGPN